MQDHFNEYPGGQAKALKNAKKILKTTKKAHAKVKMEEEPYHKVK